MIRVLLFDRFDAPIGELKPDEVLVITRHEAVNGEHSLEITTTRVLEKGWRILTRDARGKWREHVVYGTDDAHEAGERVLGTYYCTWSVQHDLMGTRTSRMPGVQNPVAASVALGYAIEGTSRWQRGTVTNTNYAGASMYDMDGWEAVSVLVENWGGEVDATIEVIGDEITARKLDLYNMQGDQDAKRRFDFGADLKSVHRRIADGPLYCRITPRGKGEQTDDGYGRKVRITSVNQGKDYLENPEMVDLAKLPDGNGGWEYPTLEVENSNCETPQELMEWALTVRDEYTTPNVSYEVDVLQAAAEGVDMQGVSLGDSVQVVDRKFGDGLRLAGRVLEMSVNMLDERDAKLVIGNVDKGIVQVFGDLKARLDMVSKTVWNMNGGTYSTAEYLSELIARLNADINATGGYTYITEGQGIRTYDTAVSDPLVGSEANAVVEVKGGTIRIANSKTAQGAWEWKTVFTSGHIAANLVTAAQITAGYIGNASAGSYWDLDNNELVIASGATIGGSTVGDLLQDVSSANQQAARAITDAAEAAKTATNYLTFNSTNGLDVGYSGTNAKTRIKGNGVEIFDSAGNSALFAGIESSKSIVRVGKSSGSGNVVMSSDGYVDIRRSSTILAHFGYGIGANEYGGTSAAPYYSIGPRSTQSGRTTIGNYSTTIGTGNAASGYATAAIGWDCYAYGNAAVAIGDMCQAYQGVSLGVGAVANPNQVAVGVYNTWSADTTRFVVGEGTSTNRSNSFSVYTNGNAWLKGTLTQGSDRRLKKHISYLENDAAEFIRKLKPALFEKDGGKHLGFYAQDVQEAEQWDSETVGVAVNCDESLGFDPLTLDYTALIAPLVAYAQSLEKRIEQLEARIAALEGRDA